jgi:hypothetical protein
VTHLEARNSRAGAACTSVLSAQIFKLNLRRLSNRHSRRPRSQKATHAACVLNGVTAWNSEHGTYKIQYAKLERGAMMDRSQQTDSRGAACIDPVEERKGNYCRWARAQAAPWLLVWAAGVKHRALTPAHHSLSDSELFVREARGAGGPSQSVGVASVSLSLNISATCIDSTVSFLITCALCTGGELRVSCICIRPWMNYRQQQRRHL